MPEPGPAGSTGTITKSRVGVVCDGQAHDCRRRRTGLRLAVREVEQEVLKPRALTTRQTDGGARGKPAAFLLGPERAVSGSK